MLGERTAPVVRLAVERYALWAGAPSPEQAVADLLGGGRQQARQRLRNWRMSLVQSGRHDWRSVRLSIDCMLSLTIVAHRFGAASWQLADLDDTTTSLRRRNGNGRRR